MRTKRWSALFSIEILDTTKKNGEVWDLVVTPTDACLEKIKKLGLLFKRTPNGIVIIGESSDKKEPLKDIKPEVFTFYLTALNRNLETKLGVDRKIFNSNSPILMSGTGVFYFDNLDETGKILRGSAGSSIQTLYNKEEKLTDADKALLVGNDVGITFKQNLTTVLTQKGTEIARNEGEADTFKSFNFNKLKKDPDTHDFINLPDGLYHFSWGDTSDKQVNIYKSDGLLRVKPFGIVEIFENNEMPLGKTTHYTLELVRQMRWQYMVLHKKDAPITDISLNVKMPSGVAINFESFETKPNDTSFEVNFINRVEKQYEAKAILYRSVQPVLVDYKTAELTWTKDSKNFKEKLAIPTADSSAVVITYKIES